MKKTIAIFVVMILCTALCSCGYNPEKVGYVLLPDGTTYDIGCGWYLVAQFAVADTALYTLDSTGTMSIQEIEEQKIDGVPAREWIAEKTKEVLVRAQAVECLYNELGYSLTSDQLYLYEYSIGYGWSNYYTIFMENGISYDTYYAYQMNVVKDATIYSQLYGNGGAKELSDERVRAYMSENATKADLIKLPNTKGSGEALTDEEKQQLADLAVLFTAAVKEKGMAKAVEEYKAQYEQLLSSQGCMDNLLAENDIVVRDTTSESDELTEAVLATSVSHVGVLDYQDGSYSVFCVKGFSEDDTVETLRTKMVEIVGPGLYESELEDYMAEWTVELDEKAVKYYSPDKIVF